MNKLLTLLTLLWRASRPPHPRQVLANLPALGSNHLSLFMEPGLRAGPAIFPSTIEALLLSQVQGTLRPGCQDMLHGGLPSQGQPGSPLVWGPAPLTPSSSLLSLGPGLCPLLNCGPAPHTRAPVSPETDVRKSEHCSGPQSEIRMSGTPPPVPGPQSETRVSGTPPPAPGPQSETRVWELLVPGPQSETWVSGTLPPVPGPLAETRVSGSQTMPVAVIISQGVSGPTAGMGFFLRSLLIGVQDPSVLPQAPHFASG